MELPKFVVADNTDFPDDIFIIHLEYPRFVINLESDEIEFLEDLEEEDAADIEEEMEDLVVLAGEFYERESLRYAEYDDEDDE
ncbi:hypothetical protein K5I29_07180 [Flavobacterium agricola]|uniref:Uncharacterized protein n=1 Tax=Flavobacterium agricola TaxID=2870839 RepID=A0ABY6LYW8_9FLAO|nr:hypothetical protein [Flavobacterium agricola]UYW00355.1 hypothetical protein K5I29_07180 [Flavobacterium agricola]